MGQVWLADHKGLDIQVAVKFMRRDVADDPVSVARFEQEAKLAARIKSPHVVEVFDYDVTDTGVPFIVMESLKGRDLETVLQNSRTLSLSDTARVLVQTCRALSKAHALGVIHRDIKAENVFVVQDEGAPIIKILDFGVAKETLHAHGISLSGTTVGTPAYMSPEQLFHPKEIDLRTDLWATAVLVYRCLTGAFPFEGESFPSVCLSVSKGKFAPASARSRDLPVELDAWFRKAFHKSLEARFCSAPEMAEAFLAALCRADLLPSWAEGGIDGPTSASLSVNAYPPAERRWPRSMARFVQAGLALSVILAVGGAAVAPETARGVVTDLASKTAESARGWAVDEGLYPPSLLETHEDAGAFAEKGRALDVTWRFAPSTLALAERQMDRETPLASPAVAARQHVTTIALNAPAPLAMAAAASSAPASIPAPEALPEATPSTEAPAGSPATDLATIRFGL
jgi:eukaryotic-like serine/threonine-protein kinase